MTTSRVSPNAPIHWVASSVLFGTFFSALLLVPLYAWFFDFSTAAWVSFVALSFATGMSITGGYHRLWAHRSYKAHWVVRLFFMIFGSMTLQNSILVWASGHRTHHRHVDDTEWDPYSAKRGFWFSHIGWMLRRYESGADNFSNAPDLLKDPIVMFQHKHYLALAIGTNFGIPFLIGFLAGDFWGVVVLAGLFRLVWVHHCTFFINSLAHIWGRRPYTDENTARDNDLLALLTYGEGYHNYHHLFQYDYRNGIRWYQFDPTKWLISMLSAFGLTSELKRTPEFAIEKARIAMQFKKAQQKLDQPAQSSAAQLEQWRAKVAAEYEQFSASLQRWASLKEAWYADMKAGLEGHATFRQYKAKFAELDRTMRYQRRRMKAILRQMTQPVSTPA